MSHSKVTPFVCWKKKTFKNEQRIECAFQEPSGTPRAQLGWSVFAFFKQRSMGPLHFLIFLNRLFCIDSFNWTPHHKKFNQKPYGSIRLCERDSKLFPSQWSALYMLHVLIDRKALNFLSPLQIPWMGSNHLWDFSEDVPVVVSHPTSK